MTNSKTLQWTFLAIVVILSISIYSCRKDNDEECCDPTNPECPNYDPCYGVEEPSAEFFMEERVYDQLEDEFLWIHDDEIFKGTEIRFRSPHTESEVEHTWYIGSDIYDDPNVLIEFDDVPRPATITISHVMEFPVDSTCYPLSTGRDSVAQTFQLMDYYSDLITVGSTLRGAFENQTDTFNVKFRIRNQDGSPAQWNDNFIEAFRINLHNQGDSLDQFTDLTLSNSFLSFTGSGGGVPMGNLTIDKETQSFRLEYRWEDFEDYVFKGRILE